MAPAHSDALAVLKTGIQLGQHTLRNNLALAPMAGLSDVPFRTLAWRYGAGYLVSEMVSAKPELWDTGKSRLRRVPVVGAFPGAVQIAGTEPSVLAEAAQRHADDGVQVIDINFGCPAKKVCKKAAGSALLGDIDRIGEIVAAVTEAVDIPVTVKTRTGLVPGDGAGLQAAKIAAEAGASLIVMHARSRACRFVGAVDYQAVAEVRRQVASTPFFVNGDIGTVAQAAVALQRSGTDGAMIGRAALGRPWLFAQLLGQVEPDLAEKWAVVLEHLHMLHDFYGEKQGVRIARKHLLAYLEHLGIGAGERGDLLRVETAIGQLGQIQRLADNQLKAAA